MLASALGEARLRRSLLFVPGSDPRKLERAGEAGADTIILDLEDAVAPERKAEARSNVAAVIRAGGLGGAEVAVRVNAPGTPELPVDIGAVVAAGAAAIVLPKAENAARISEVAVQIAASECERAPGGEPVKLLLLVETPLGIARALELGGASERVAGLCFGHADFAAQMGLAEADASSGVVHHARCSLAVAAKACGVAPIDCVALAVKDEDACRADAELGLRLGFEGKLCIHPRQVEIVNRVYTPSRGQIDEALRVVEAAESALREGRGAFALDGKMIDAPLVAVKRRILERARQAGLLGD
jgi:citrate lyase subunit beta/citryl-CoA lyase